MSGLKPVLARLAAGEVLNADEAAAAFAIVMRGEASAAQTGALLTALRVRGETVDEIAGAVTAMRGAMLSVEAPPHAIDCCGTGGDGAHTLNISTAVAFVLAGAGVAVAKHGNRAITSKSGAADVLASLGVPVELEPAAAAAALAQNNFAFLFAPKFHPAMRHVGPVRQELGFRTLFNLLGPLANPAGVKRQLIGAPTIEAARKIAGVLALLGVERAWVASGHGGLDEISPSGESTVFIVEDGGIAEHAVTPDDAGLPRHPIEAIRGGDATVNAAALIALLDGERGAYRDTVVLNAAAALVVAGKSASLIDGARLAAETIDSGAASERLKQASSR
ncbi:Anthranilate phosphoribosyltransferase [Alphaproteobacteria bacterium SO-S41]|nr:Anthranilate phosphoribosyltransferase [Alphaproteobacteria bacterium SO-S41]